MFPIMSMTDSTPYMVEISDMMLETGRSCRPTLQVLLSACSTHLDSKDLLDLSYVSFILPDVIKLTQ
jgi:hypothetical protein